MPWLQLRITSQRQQAQSIEDGLLDAGALSVTLEDNADQPILEPGLGETPLWDSTRITGLFDATVDTQKIDQQLTALLTNTESRWELLEDKDWEREWMANYHPIQCGNRLWICPSWQTPPAPEAVNLLLDPGLAFGTGTHPTTFLCLQWLDHLNLQDKHVIDYGCGSGILAIAALLLGAKTATGIDIDPQALTATNDNATRNHIDPVRINTFFPEKSPNETADIVIANILAGPLTELAQTLAALTRPGGLLCLSGIMQSQADIVMQSYAQWFDFDPVASKEEWVRLTAIRR
jgi:ribosomal protein L11 methyltransferase